MSVIAVPNDFGAECTILKELITTPQAVATHINFLTEEMFYNDENKKIFNVIKSMYENHEVADIVTVTPKVDNAHFMQNIIPAECSYSVEVIESHCAHLRNVAARRKMYFFAQKMLNKCSDNFATEEEILSLPSVFTNELTKTARTSHTQSLKQVFAQMDKEMHEGVQKRIPTGFPRLDMLTYGGFAKGQLVVLAARPSVGKTAFMLQMARTSSSQGIPTLALSLEMTNDELAQRIVFSTGYVGAADMARGKFDWTMFDLAYSKHANDLLYLDDTVHTIDDVCATVTINHIQGQCDIAFIDYVQLMSDTNSKNSLYQQVSGITKRLKQLAKTLGIPIVLLAQLNRNSVAEKRSPELHDLRDSGSIEQDADLVLMLERMETPKGQPKQVKMWVRKNRGGEGSDVEILVEAGNGYTIFKEIQ
jgi:replicative DNA helicase